MRCLTTIAAATLAALAVTGGANAASIFEVDLAHDKIGDQSQFRDIKDFCGTKPMRIALSDGFGGNSWRKIVLAEFKDEASKCPNITEIKYTDAQGDVQKHIADMQSLVAQKFDIIVLYPDGGEALLRAMKDATAAGVAVVPFAVGEDFAGTPGVDYLERVTEGLEDRGVTKAKWLAEAMGKKGDIVVLGGTPGNPTDISEERGWRAEFAKYPDIKVLEGPVVTNWTPSEAQKVMAGLIAKYEKIDGVFYNFGIATLQTLRAFEAAGRSIPAQVTEDNNALSCYWYEVKDKNPNFALASTSGRPWMVRNALRKAVAAVQGMPNDEPSIIRLPLYEDSIAGGDAAPKCNADLPPDAILSSQLPPEKLAEALK
jgi:ribose transport system substrate-binding protein